MFKFWKQCDIMKVEGIISNFQSGHVNLLLLWPRYSTTKQVWSDVVSVFFWARFLFSVLQLVSQICWDVILTLSQFFLFVAVISVPLTLVARKWSVSGSLFFLIAQAQYHQLVQDVLYFLFIVPPNICSLLAIRLSFTRFGLCFIFQIVLQRKFHLQWSWFGEVDFR